MTNTFATESTEPLAAEDVPMPGRSLAASSLVHREMREDEFWRRIPAYADVPERTFLDHQWQLGHAITEPDQLLENLGGLVSETFVADVETGCRRGSMRMRVSPYIFSLVDWKNPYEDPLRIQFIPLGSRQLPDHPLLRLDALSEQADSPVPGLVHRYPDKALFLALATCPVYCRFCTRSYAVGADTVRVSKVVLGPDRERWAGAFRYIASRTELEDIVVSGGDVWQLRPEQLREIVHSLLGFDHVRRVRIATKGPAVLPMKLLSHEEYTQAVTDLADHARRLGKSVVVHTHFNHPNEITAITRRALDRLFQRGVLVRNQTVLLRGVNDTPETMTLLIKRLGYLNVQPYYVFLHDLVKGVEELRTPVHTALHIEKQVRGATAGFHTPTFAVDTLGGGGKRDVHSFEAYDRENGIAVYTAPAVRPGRTFLYLDPIDQLSAPARSRWADPDARRAMIDNALSRFES